MNSIVHFLFLILQTLFPVLCKANNVGIRDHTVDIDVSTPPDFKTALDQVLKNYQEEMEKKHGLVFRVRPSGLYKFP